jgi:DNA invertase Pin-like site-specific DNA recombinase
MSGHRPEEITDQHLRRLALVYLRQSTQKQVEEHKGSTAFQRDQKAHALRWGWPEKAIVVIDDDLGVSGRTVEAREGFKRMRRLVAQEDVGIICMSLSDRMGRNSDDSESLLSLCRDTDTLLAIDGAIVDLNDPSDRLLARIRANFAEFENDQRTLLSMNTKRKLAANGHAVNKPPTGYVVAEKGKWVKDQDITVRERVEQVFRIYDTLGTVGKVTQFFARNGLEFPIRCGATPLRWVHPTRVRIHCMLTNPAYGGWYIWGRRPLVRGTRVDRRRKTTWDEWIKVPDHHEPYVSPADWHRINARLRSRPVTARPPAGMGPALCQGLLRCGKDGYKFKIHYHRKRRTRGFTYLCDRGYIERGLPKCWHVSGRNLDEVVVSELFRAFAPPEIDAVVAAAGDVNAAYEALRSQRAVEVERGRYEAELAEKRHKAVHPDNRLVEPVLQADLQRALEKVKELERRHFEEPLTRPLELTPEAVEAIRRLNVELPTVWGAATTTDQDRKDLLRLFVHEVRVVDVSPEDFKVDVEWVGGAVTRHSIFQPLAGGFIARRLAAEGLRAAEIAAHLNRLGVRTEKLRGPYSRHSILAILGLARRRAGLVKPRRVRPPSPHPTVGQPG